jgi:hypothetical protein
MISNFSIIFQYIRNNVRYNILTDDLERVIL